MGDICVVTVAHGRHAHLANQLRMLAASDPDSTHVVVAINDDRIADVVAEHRGGRDVYVLAMGSHKAGLPLAAARNLGVRHALAEGAEVIVLLDVDCVLAPGALSHYAEAASMFPSALLCGAVTYLTEGTSIPDRADLLHPLRNPHADRPDPAPGAYEPGDNHNLFWSLSAALTPATWLRIEGFCEEYVGYGGEDTDFAWTARTRGVDLVWVGGADAYHQHHPVSSPPIEHVDAIVRNAHLFHNRWGQWPMVGWLRAFAERGLVAFDGTTLSVHGGNDGRGGFPTDEQSGSRSPRENP